MGVQMLRKTLALIGEWSVALALRFYVGLVIHTSRCEVAVPPETKELLKQHTPVMILFWHSRIMLLPYFAKIYEPNIAAVVSRHRDGGYVTRFLSLYGLGIIRGSSSRGAIQALKGVIESLRSGISIAITPDGPTGPRYQINSSAHRVAARMQIPVILACYSATKARTLGTWDRFVIPLPFCRIIFEMSEPIYLTEEKAGNSAFLNDMMRKQVEKLDQRTGLQTEY